MKNLTTTLLLICIVGYVNIVQAQVDGNNFELPLSIRADGAQPDSSAMLDVQSTTKGILIPRMTTAQRTVISSPATSLMVYDTDTGSFWFYNGSSWQEVGADNLGDHTATQTLDLANQNIINGDTITATAFVGDGSGLTNLPGDNFGNHTATQTLDLANQNITNGDTITATVFVGNGSGLTNLPVDNLGNHTAMQTLELANQNITNGATITATAFVGNGSGLTNLPVDNLGNHTATQTLDLANQNITNGDTITATVFMGNGSGLTNLPGDNLGNHTATQTLDLANQNITNGATITATAFVGNGSGLTNLPVDKLLTDADNDTKILVEANPDEDVIHAYVKNVEGLQLNQNGLFAPGTYNFNGALPVNGAGVRLMWAPSLAALRVGAVNGTQWNEIGHYSSVLGGENNAIPYAGLRSVIAGGTNNLIEGSSGFIGAGEYNHITGNYAGISGGLYNTASGNQSFIGTGQYNTASGVSSVVAGGEDNNATGNFSTVAGYGNKAASYGEVTLGLFATNYTAASTSGFNGSDRIFAIGNGSANTSRSNALTVLKNGNVGIGTSAPSNKLSVTGNADFTGNVGFGTAAPSNKLSVEGNANFNGNVGIGTTNPTKGKLEIAGGGSSQSVNNFGFLNSSGVAAYASGGPFNYTYSIWANDKIAATEFNAFSDMRIKKILGPSNREQDLSTLMGIEITDYTLIDTLTKGTQSYKKVIAQQVNKVFPQAVSTLTDVVPDIYQRAGIEDGWIQLATDLQPGERVKIITDQSAEVYEVTAAEASRFKVEQLPGDDSRATTVFVYGREVNDFHTVDYEAIAMLNVSATQEQQRRIEALEEALETQAERINKLEAMLLQIQRHNITGKESIKM